ncbi:MAG: hypothetical protein JWR26_4895 [Pedosphaera sp.]|nr:hypothetical protein [Pedosphaera sp.]
MNDKVLEQFLSEDGEAHVRRKLLDAIHSQSLAGSPLLKKYSFNRFIVSLDFETKQVTIEDDLTTGAQGEYKLGMQEFAKALQGDN